MRSFKFQLETALLDQMSIDRRNGLATVVEGSNVLHAETLESNVRVQRGSGIVREHLDVLHLDELLVDVGLVKVHVEPGRVKVAALQGGHEGRLVNELAAGDVDDAGALLHLGELVGVDEGVAAKGRGDEHAVGLGQQGVHVLVEGGRHRRRDLDHVVVQDLHVHRGVGLFGDPPADAAVANDAQAEAVGVARHGRQVLVGVGKLLWASRACGQRRPRE